MLTVKEALNQPMVISQPLYIVIIEPLYIVTPV